MSSFSNYTECVNSIAARLTQVPADNWYRQQTKTAVRMDRCFVTNCVLGSSIFVDRTMSECAAVVAPLYASLFYCVF
jgi:hypothetical protein